jgi:hypothetical protein
LVEVVADEPDQCASGRAVGLCAVELELVSDPALERFLRRVPDQELAYGRDRFGEWYVLLELAGGDQGQRGRRSRRFEVRRDRLRVVRLPRLDAFDDDQPAVARKEAERVARGHHVVAGLLGGKMKFERVVSEAAAEPVKRPVDLRPVTTGEEIRRLQLLRHRHQA